ncbi:nucleotide sugar dehydrogenase [Priestia megaterium]|uniref:Nucleotide sugar dehydrogenase family protein n=1 Tax=Priestia megaterium (strain ATCC 14581 / DSM 32 / CCUG 1817 / JCM 2506 / NBRC 15308 / NCIMB 9376 / NCTC 10342 / NRRL B-14308 / VKM B-512 / Ford 19) TaxID=1348623 RepID=A0A0B6ADF6_PRIM2|nr:nucleotide sugar dehydrogenase [Priestia megaterium]AJI22915.1 nucleotide sugar dehydrogenase family protein [Priestia megaterium NBRC 15308 = ATCC 14581]KFM96977.1 UDP-N-acetyl-D-mannosamine dehydrogenase [Priestia megaterium]KGJ84413.1 UDP-N-acetyl-D-mannosamine dehydrogenase [Priestia megaterium NBRC 15308 = ATCC 14581]MDR4233419.1 nucleotide sugar dehydrogenase [Priestia megaterium]MED3807072.1 nucleotide sugar dehydrogenase [Priestia megaterium]
MKLCTVGLGYIGLPTSIMFAKHDVEVTGVDISPRVIESLNNGKIHLEEPGLQEALNEVIAKGTFKAALQPEKADAFIVAVPTPNNNDENKSCDLSYVLSAVNMVIPHLEKGNVLIVESTIAPRSMDDYVKPVLEAAGYEIGKDIFLVHCPERVLPGQILHELVHNNRIVGGMTPNCTEAGAMVYSTFVKGEIIKTDAKTAEMSKLMENTFRDVNIALANELAKVCNELEINALEVVEMANKHPRVNLHTPGPGVGGHCLAVDPYFIVAKAPKTAQLINLARTINTSMPHYVVENANKLMQKVDGKIITVFGLTYKGNVDDIRESPAMEIYDILKAEGKYEVRAFDPHVEQEWVVSDIKDAVQNSDLVLILSDHNEFKELNWDELNGMSTKQIFDTKNIVTNRSDNFSYINYGNLHVSLKKKEVMA